LDTLEGQVAQFKTKEESRKVTVLHDKQLRTLHTWLQGSHLTGAGGAQLMFGVNLNNRQAVELKLNELNAKEKEYSEKVRNEMDKRGLATLSIESEALDAVIKLAKVDPVDLDDLSEIVKELKQVRLQLEDLKKGIDFSKRARKILQQTGYVENLVVEQLQKAIADNKAAIREVIIANDEVWVATKALRAAESIANKRPLEAIEKEPQTPAVQMCAGSLAAAEAKLKKAKDAGQVKQKELTSVLQEVALSIDLEDISKQIEETDKTIKVLENKIKERVILTTQEAIDLETLPSKLKQYQSLQQVILRYGIRINNPAEPLRKEQEAKAIRDFKGIQQWIRLGGIAFTEAIESLRAILKSEKAEEGDQNLKNLDRIMNCAIEIEEMDRMARGIKGLENFIRDNEHNMALCHQIAIYFAYSIILSPIALILFYVEQLWSSAGEESEKFSKECKKWFGVTDNILYGLVEMGPLGNLEVTTTYDAHPKTSENKNNLRVSDSDSS